MYVAMTRARERLVLSGAVDFERWSERRQAATAISWLGPALVADLPTLAQAAAGQTAGRSVDWAPTHDLPLGLSGNAHVCVRLNLPASAGEVLGLDSTAAGEVGGRAAGYVRSTERAPSSIPATRPSSQADLGTLSYTALSELERCGYRYYLERVLGLGEDCAVGVAETFAGTGLDPRARGTLVHRLLEDVDFSRPVAPSSEQVGRMARELGMRALQSEREEIAALLQAACRSSLAARLAGAGQIRREHPFAFSLAVDEPSEPIEASARLIAGVIDLLARERDGLLVVDYKSDRVGAEVDLQELVGREYGVQRLIYALAVLRGGAAGVEVVHWFLERPDDPVSARFDAEDRDGLEAQLAARLGRARVDPFRVSATPHRGLCLTCPGRAGLCSWDEAYTLRAEP